MPAPTLQDEGGGTQEPVDGATAQVARAQRGLRDALTYLEHAGTAGAFIFVGWHVFKQYHGQNDRVKGKRPDGLGQAARRTRPERAGDRWWLVVGPTVGRGGAPAVHRGDGRRPRTTHGEADWPGTGPRRCPLSRCPLAVELRVVTGRTGPP